LHSVRALLQWRSGKRAQVCHKRTFEKIGLAGAVGSHCGDKKCSNNLSEFDWQLLVLLRDATAETPLTNAVDFGAKRLCYDLVFVACKAFNYNLVPQQAKTCSSRSGSSLCCYSAASTVCACLLDVHVCCPEPALNQHS